MKYLNHMKNYLISWMDESTDYLEESLDGERTDYDRFEYYAYSCGVSPFILRNWLIGRGKPDWEKVAKRLDDLGVCYIPAGER